MPVHDVCWLQPQQRHQFLYSLICWLRVKNKDYPSETCSFFQGPGFMTHMSTNFIRAAVSVLQHQPAFRLRTLLFFPPPFIILHISLFSLSISSSSAFLIFSTPTPSRSSSSCAYTHNFNVLAALR